MIEPPDDPWEFGIRATDVPVVDGVFALFGNATAPDAEIIELHEALEITELSPVEHKYAGKRIELDNHITSYPQDVKDWYQTVARIPIGIVPLFHYLCEARWRNIILIRGAPSDLSRQPTRRLKELFEDEPSRLLFFDIDGAPFNWRADPEAALRQIAVQMGEPWASASFVWLYSASHGLGTETFRRQKRWIGSIVDGKVRVRLAFLLDRPIDEAEAVSLTKIAQAQAGFLVDDGVARISQPNYIARPYWAGHRGEDPLGDIPTIGWIKGTHEFAAVPADLKHKARWAKAQGHTSDIASHPDALSAVLGIGTDGRVRAHLKSAIIHLAKANPPPPLVSFPDHAATLAQKLGELVAQHDVAIQANLAAFKRSLGDVEDYLPFNMPEWAEWILKNFDDLVPRSIIRLTYEPRAESEPETSKQETFDRVFRVVKDAVSGATLLIAPPGSRKSTLVRAAAVAYVRAHPGESVVILVPRHDLGDEQVKALYREHPEGDFIAAVRRSRLQDDPDRPGKQMCLRPEEMKAMEKGLVRSSRLCQHTDRHGQKTFCPHFELGPDQCGFQRTRMTPADIWFSSHELMPYKMPTEFGNVGWLAIDEDPRDAFMVGTDTNVPFELDLDTLKYGPWRDFRGRDLLMEARLALYHALDQLPVPDDPHLGTPVGHEHLQDFFRDRSKLFSVPKYDPGQMSGLEWAAKVEPAIRPDMPKKQVLALLTKAESNGRIQRLATLWHLISQGGDGRVQIHKGKHGRIIRMVGLRPIAKDWKDLPTLITDGTGDATLLRAIWPKLKCDREDDWQQLPRPDNVRVFQVVDKAFSKLMIAVEEDDDKKNKKKLPVKIAAARRLYAAMLSRALDYGGQDVGLIVYKSTEEWIRENCHVPPWLKLAHHGAVTGSNEMENVRALFVVGRILVPDEAVTRQTEACFGAYIADRDYRVRREGGKIHIVPDAAGNNTILVDVWEHPHPLAERVHRQGTEAALLQAAQRGRPGLRGPHSPLDIFLLTNVPLPEIGAVEPMLWSELDDGLDAMMLAMSGVWLKNISDAAEAYGGLFKAKGLETSRNRSQARGVPSKPIGSTIGNEWTPRTCSIFRYQRTGTGKKPCVGLSLRGPDETRTWLEARLGKLVLYEMVAADEDGREAAE